jgi:hypothetical protein
MGNHGVDLVHAVLGKRPALESEGQRVDAY